MPKPKPPALKKGRRKELSPFVVFLFKCILGIKKNSGENDSRPQDYSLKDGARVSRPLWKQVYYFG